MHGSVAYGEAISGISDLDCYLVLNADLTNDDKEYINNLENLLCKQYKVLNGAHIALHSVNDLKEDNCMWKGMFEEYLELYKATAPY